MTRRILPAAVAIGAVLALAAIGNGAPEGWHKKLEDGVEASKRSGKPVLVVTTWTDRQ